MTTYKYRMIVTGKKTLNGKDFSITLKGEVDTEHDIYYLAGHLAKAESKRACEMEYPTAIQVTVEKIS